jgi:GH24 family phage-related lysozyme (muramidase)
MRTSREGIQFIAGREALVLVAYEDGEHPDGKPRYSIGFGDNSAKAGDKIAPDEAWKNLVANVRLREKVVNGTLTKPVTQHQFDAIMSAYYQGRNQEPFAPCRGCECRASRSDPGYPSGSRYQPQG